MGGGVAKKVPNFLFDTDRVHAKGVVLCERACFCLLSAFYSTPPLLRTILRTSLSIETLTRRLLRTLLRSTSLKNLLRTLLRSVRLHDPLGVRPNGRFSSTTSSFLEEVVNKFR